MTFLNYATLNPKYLTNKGAELVFNFLSEPANIYKCIIFSEKGLPVLTGIVEEIENKFLISPDFPLTDYTNRQYVGRMVKYIMGFYGYTPKESSLTERHFRTFANAKHFKTSSIYEKTKDPIKNIIVSST